MDRGVGQGCAVRLEGSLWWKRSGTERRGVGAQVRQGGSPGAYRECAAGRGAESLAQPGGTRRKVPGPSAYLKAKAGGDNSMLEKRGLLEDAKGTAPRGPPRSAEHTSALQPHLTLVLRLLLEQNYIAALPRAS